jgi:catechol 2,3-dioxygenase-like lactoylglutathione lyase family enzyme
MFSHIMIGTNDLDKAKAFYDALLGTLEVRPAKVDGHRIFYFTKTGVFSVTKPINGEPATCANGGTIGFAASSPEQVDRWHAAGVVAGGMPDRKPARHPRGRGEQALYRLFARPRRQQDLRDASDAELIARDAVIPRESGESSTPQLLGESPTSRNTGSPGQAGR